MHSNSMRRSTYFASGDDPFSHLRVKDGRTAEVRGLQAARHVRTQLARPVPNALGVLAVEWKSADIGFLDLPFDPPVASGLHILADLESEVEEVTAFLQTCGVDTDYEPIESSGWLTYFDLAFRADSVDVSAGDTELTRNLIEASAFRISTDPESQQVTIDAWYPSQIWHTEEPELTEVGVFKVVKHSDAYTLTGRTRRLGKDDKSTPAMFRWYPKHYKFDSRADVSLALPYGLHPTLELFLDAEPPLPSCKLFAQLELPRSVFLDQYELDDLQRMSPRSELISVWGEADLEKPEWQVSRSSVGLFRLFESVNASYKIPAHFRYQRPSTEKQVSGEIAAPHVFWACKSDDSGRKTEFLDSYDFLGIESLFPPEETTFHVWQSNDVSYRVPTIDPGSAPHAEWATVVVVIAGTFCILAATAYKLWNVPRKLKVE